ncbi:hypothetical protein Hanom_Chr08g00708881 [Helianthus anomalus]
MEVRWRRYGIVEKDGIFWGCLSFPRNYGGFSKRRCGIVEKDCVFWNCLSLESHRKLWKFAADV